MLRICDQASIVQQPPEKNEKCKEIPVLIINYNLSIVNNLKTLHEDKVNDIGITVSQSCCLY
jgi:hypothetical protein